ncbi:MAG: ABC transporter ATP-binding protein, partial [Actinomycetota bacterium]|nr:ABC transporter ATP-binding protein [Actinomycetota bacterium]
DPGAVRSALAGVPGATVSPVAGRDDAVHVLAHVEGAEQAALRAVLEVGEVARFAPDLPSLADLFRGVVSEEEPASEVEGSVA